MNWFESLHPIIQALLETGFTWAVTAFGAAGVFTAKEPSRRMLDGMLAFAAGAMVSVVVKELIPEAQRGGNTDFATMGAMVGFTVMMILDVALG